MKLIGENTDMTQECLLSLFCTGSKFGGLVWDPKQVLDLRVPESRILDPYRIRIVVIPVINPSPKTI